MAKLDDTLNRFTTAREVLLARQDAVRIARTRLDETAKEASDQLEAALAQTETAVAAFVAAQAELREAEACVKPAQTAVIAAGQALHNLLPSVLAGLGAVKVVEDVHTDHMRVGAATDVPIATEVRMAGGSGGVVSPEGSVGFAGGPPAGAGG